MRFKMILQLHRKDWHHSIRPFLAIHRMCANAVVHRHPTTYHQTLVISIIWLRVNFTYEIKQLLMIGDNAKPSQWRHNGREGVSNHRRPDGLRNRLFRRRSKKSSLMTSLCIEHCVNIQHNGVGWSRSPVRPITGCFKMTVRFVQRTLSRWLYKGSAW